jgi:hypothetical protein
MRLPYRFALLVLVLGLLTPPASPQASTATVSGTVRDQTGAVIPSASVTLTNTGTNVVSKTSTNMSGFYIFAGIVSGPYEVLVEAAGMQKFEGKLTVQVQQSTVVDAVLTVGQASSAVSVLDVTPMVTTDNPTLGHTLERQRIEQLPINGRFIYTLLQTVPGLEQETEYDSVGTRAFGMRRGSTEYVLDGSAMTDRLMGGVFRRPPGLDTIQEFKVESNVSSAKLPRPTTVIMSTKSGTNQVHGSAFETARNNGLGKARTRTDYYSKPPQLIRNEFGVSAGGPVLLPKIYNGKNRTFWFFAYEGLRNMSASTSGFALPTTAMRNGDFSGLVDSQGRKYTVYDPWTTNTTTWARQPFVNNQLPSTRLSPMAKALIDMTPAPTIPDVNPLVAPNFFGPQPTRRRDWTISTRMDHRFSDKDQFYGRYSQGNYRQLQQFYSFVALNNVGGTVTRMAPNKAVALSWVHTFSPSLFNELLVSGSQEKWYSGTGEPGVFYNDQLGMPNPNKLPGWPALYNLDRTGDWMFETENTQKTPFAFWLVDDNATKILGRHEMQFGFHFRWDKLDTTPEQQYTQGRGGGSAVFTSLYDPASSRTEPLAMAMTGDNAASTYLGLLNYYVNLGHPTFRLRGKEYAFYFQDNFKATSRLTLNVGLRYDYWPPYSEVDNMMTSFDLAKRAIVLGTSMDTMYRLGATLPSIVQRETSLGVKFVSYQDAGLPATLYRTSRTDFGPRLGFAYRTSDGSRAMVLRGGYRISHFTIPLRAWTASQRSNAPFFATFTSSKDSSALSPDGISTWSMRSVPTIVAGVNSKDAIDVTNATSLIRGSPTAYSFDSTMPPSTVQDWNFTLEKELMTNTVVRASYVGNHTDHLEQAFNYNSATPSYIWYATTGLPLPTGEYSGVALRKYDQVVYGNITQTKMTGWSNFNGLTLEAERRYSNGYGFQLFYSMGNAFEAGGHQWSSTVADTNQFLPGRVSDNYDTRNRFLNYQRDTDVPKHRVRWNWLVDLPFGKGKALAGNSGRVLDKFIGGWQLAGMGSLRSTWFSLPTGTYPTGAAVETYGYQYPVKDCRSGVCYPGYLWWNGYIPANRINSTDPATGKPNGVMGVPSNYKPSTQPLLPWPANPDRNDPLYAYYGTNTVWVPMKNGTTTRIAYNDNLAPWRNQFRPGVRQWGLDASLFKAIPIGERVTVRFNADFFNVLNKPGNPNSVGGDGILSVRSSGQAARELQLTLRLTW